MVAAAQLIREWFDRWASEFRSLTALARVRFEQQQWHEARHDSVERLALYERSISRAVLELRDLLGSPRAARPRWGTLRHAFRAEVALRGDLELALTFFSSIARRFFDTIGVDSELEFLDAPPLPTGSRYVVRRFERKGATLTLVAELLTSFRFAVAYENLERDSRLVAAEIDREAGSLGIEALEVAGTEFFRGKGAYLVGRLVTAAGALPFVLVLLNDEARKGIRADAVLLNEDDVSIVFSYTRSYFFVETEEPRELVAFLQRVLPQKPVADLYIAIGQHKRAKTELYRSLLTHMDTTADRFNFVPGARGMVMIVFNMPSSEVVFKVFRDYFDYPKSITRAEAMAKYQLVFEHDLAGRLVDAQEFTYLEFARDKFSDEVLVELDRNARASVDMTRDTVVLKHVYTERRVTPLDVYLRMADLDAAVSAVLDYGATIRDLAATNIFPGDLLLKNFGVTRHGRVVFYDYDEIQLVTDCNFRRMPSPRDVEEEFMSSPWFNVNDGDVFPEEFGLFLGLPSTLREQFMNHYRYLLDVDFWNQMQRELRAGAVFGVFPYRSDKRLLVPQAPPASANERSPHA
jgi:isocitrate dehydrogenase kinase/phosphatase